MIGLADHLIFVNVSTVCQNEPILHSHPSLVLKWPIVMHMEYRACTLGLGEIGPEDPNFKIKTCAVGF